ncbi:hypothetical protein D3C84_676800 [compost metagenome]
MAPTVQPPCSAARQREAVPMPPLNSWQIMPLPPPTAPSATGPSTAVSRASATCSRWTWKPLMSLSRPSKVSRTTGMFQYSRPSSGWSLRSRAIRASRTTPTLWVLVKAIGLVSRPASRIHSRPVASPLPLRICTPAKQGCRLVDPGRGSISVTPVWMSRPAAVRPRMSQWPTRTPGTSVMALRRPGCSWPNWSPRSRARGFIVVLVVGGCE